MMEKRQDSNFNKRIIVGLIFGPMVAWIFYICGIALYFFITALTFIGQMEMYGMFGKKVPYPHRFVGFLMGFCIITDAFLWNSSHFLVIISSALTISFIIEIIYGKKTRLEHIIFSMFAILYPAVFAAFLLNIARISPKVPVPHANLIILFTLLMIWLFDSASYFVGLTFGKRKFFPEISPKKTLEGFFGGMVAVIAAGVLTGIFLLPGYIIHITAISIIIVIFGQLGDLTESTIKREMGIKDSSTLIPGHGGILDRFDSLIFAAPVVYLYLILFLLPAGGYF